MSMFNDIFGFELFPFTDYRPPVEMFPRRAMKYQGSEYFVGDEVIIRDKRYVVKEIEGRYVVVVPFEMAEFLKDAYIAEEVRRRLNDGGGA
jgi:IMP dehydrogenase/GMP reductase